MRLTTGRERSRRYQREANDLLEEQLDAMQNLAQPQTPQTPSDTRPRGKCPECLEMMLQGASTCPYCHTTGITWRTETTQEPNAKDACNKCGGQVTLDGSRLYCLQCKKQFQHTEYPHFLNTARKRPVETKGGEKPCERCGGKVEILSHISVVCLSCGRRFHRENYPHVEP